MALFVSNKKIQHKNIELTRFLGRLLGYGLDLKTAMSEVRCFAHLLGIEKGNASSTGCWAEVSQDLREGFALSGTLEKNGSILPSENVEQIRKAEKEGTLTYALGNIGSLIDSPFCDDEGQEANHALEAATISMVDRAINDALKNKADEICLSLKPLVDEQIIESADTIDNDLKGILSELSKEEKPPFHISIMTSSSWQPYCKVPFVYFNAVINCILYRAGLPYWEKEDMQGKFRVPFNGETVDIEVNYYSAKKEIYLKL